VWAIRHIEGRLWKMRLKGPKRDFAGAVCNGGRPPRGDRPGFLEEKAEDARREIELARAMSVQ
jgi:hypothetical protein